MYSLNSPPLVKSGGKKSPPVEGTNHLSLLTALKEYSFLISE